MSLTERNRFLQVLHKNKATRKQIDWIMKDIDASEIFFEPDDYEDDYEEVQFERAMNVVFNHHKTTEEKRLALQSLKTDKAVKKGHGTGKLIVTDKMLYAQQRKMIAIGLVMDGSNSIEEPCGEQVELNGLTRFGRSPLHEAIALRDMKFVKKCIKQKKYLEAVDNNKNTPREMAYYEGWTEAASLLSKVKN